MRCLGQVFIETGQGKRTGDSGARPQGCRPKVSIPDLSEIPAPATGCSRAHRDHWVDSGRSGSPITAVRVKAPNVPAAGPCSKLASPGFICQRLSFKYERGSDDVRRSPRTGAGGRCLFKPHRALEIQGPDHGIVLSWYHASAADIMDPRHPKNYNQSSLTAPI